MTIEEINSIIKELKPYAKNTLMANVLIPGIGDIEIEVKTENEVDSGLLKSILEYTKSNLRTLKENSNKLLNSMADVKEFNPSDNKTNIEFRLAGISINNKQNIHNQFKLVFDYDSELVHLNEDTLGFRTINLSGSPNNYYISGINWKY